MKLRPILLIPATAVCLAVSAEAAAVVKANNTNALNLTTSWTGGVLPGTEDVATWNNTVTAANSVALGADLSWLGLAVANPTGAVTMTGANVLTLGASGIDLSSATQNLTINSGVTVGADQNWTAASGRTVFVGNSTARTLTLGGKVTCNGAGTVQIGASSGNTNLVLTGSGEIVINSGTFINWLQTGSNSTGRTGATTLNAGNLVITTAVSMFGSGPLNLNGGATGSGTATGRSITNAVNIGGDVRFGGSGFSTGTMAYSGAVDLGGATRTLTTTVATTFSGVVSNGGITKAGTAGLTLSGANTFTGPLTVTTGTLTVSGSLGGGTYAPNIANSGTLAFSGSGTQTLDGVISGTGALTFSGTGALVLTGANTYTGATTLSGGTVVVNGSLASAITMASGARIGGVGSSTGSLTTVAGAQIGITGGATTTGLTVNGLSLGGATVANFLSAPVEGTTYDVITYGAGGVMGASNLSVFARGTLAQDTLNNKFTFTATSGPQTRTWAIADGTWDTTATLANWAEGDQLFYPFDNVVFGEIAANTAITVTGNVNPSSVSASNSANTLTFSGSGSIVGTGGLTKTGAGTVALTTANLYTGTTTVSEGTLQLGNGGTSGSLARTSAIAVAAGATFHFNRSSVNDTGFANNISGGGTLLKSGTGELGLTGANTFSGLIDIQGGKVGLTSADSENGKPSVNIASGTTFSIGQGFEGGLCTIGNLTGAGAVDTAFGGSGLTAIRTLEVNQSTDGTFSGTLADATGGRILGLSKAGPATLTLTGTSTYTGPTTVNAGTLVLPSRNLAASNITVADSATLVVVNSGTQMMVNDCTLGTSGALTLGLRGVSTATGTALVKCTNLITNGTTTINLTGYYPVGTHKLIECTTRSGAGTFATGTLPAGVTGTISDTGTTVSLVVTAFSPLTWDGPEGGMWDIGMTANWKLDGTPGYFYTDGEVARFDGTAPGSSVTLDITVQPTASVFEFDSPAGIMLSGTGAIGGSGPLAKGGTGTLALNTANTFTGPVSIAGGTLVMGHAAALGTAAGGVTVATGGTLDLNGFSPGSEALTLGGGTLRNSTSTAASSAGLVTLNAGISLVAADNPITLTGAVSGPGTLAKSGTSTLTLGQASGGYAAGDVTVNAGTLVVGSAETSVPIFTQTAPRTITVNSGATMTFVYRNACGTIGSTPATKVVVDGGTVNGSSGANGSVTILQDPTLRNGATVEATKNYAQYGCYQIQGTVTVEGASPSQITAVAGRVSVGNGSTSTGVTTFQVADVTGSNAADLTVSAPIYNSGNNGANAGGLTKTGAGTLVLSAANLYTGATTVNAGTLAVTGSLAASAVTVGADATLGGNGNLGGAVTIQAGGIHQLAVAATPETQATRTIAGAFTLAPGNLLDLTAASPPAPGTYVLVTATGGITGDLPAFTPTSGVTGTLALASGGYNLELTVTSSATDYDTWAALFPGFTDTDPTHDPDNDGLSNFAEYAFGLDPTSGGSVTPVGPPNKAAGTFTYTRRTSTGLAYTCQASTTLATGSWADFTPVSQVSNHATPVETITVTIPPTLLANPGLFLRVQAATAP